ncbi:hypothetical protein IWQ56_005872, partial [Coemansia nantahalensis]
YKRYACRRPFPDMLSTTTFFGRLAHAGALDIADMPPADWCMTTLQTLTNKYEHLTSVRKANPPYAEAVLNSFKSKLLNVVSSHSLYDASDSDSEVEWPLGSNCSPYIDPKPDTDTSNYPVLSPAELADAAAAVCFADDAKEDAAMGLPSPSPSPPGDATADTAADCIPFDATGDLPELPAALEHALPSSIEDALRRFLANNSTQALSNTFSTFAGVCGAGPEPESCAAEAQDDDSDSDSAQYMSESGSLSPESPGSPDEQDPEFLAAAAADPVDIFVKTFASNGSWEYVSRSRPADGSLTPCKRKRNTDKEDRQAEADAAAPQPTKAIRLGVLPVSPRKRSRSANHSETCAAVPS